MAETAAVVQTAAPIQDVKPVEAPTPAPPAPKFPEYAPSEDCKRAQKLLQDLEQKKQRRGRLVSEIKSKEVELEHLDRTLSDLRKQIDAELKKLDPELERRPHLSVVKP